MANAQSLDSPATVRIIKQSLFDTRTVNILLFCIILSRSKKWVPNTNRKLSFPYPRGKIKTKFRERYKGFSYHKPAENNREESIQGVPRRVLRIFTDHFNCFELLFSSWGTSYMFHPLND